MKDNKLNVITLKDSIIVEFIFIIISLSVAFFYRHESILRFLISGGSQSRQVINGFLIGLGIDLALFFVLYLKRSAIMALSHLRLLTKSSYFSLLLTGVIAGIGEELLFRGVLQSFIGIWITSLIFMFAHAQFWAVPPISKGKMAFAVFAFLCGVLLGYVYIIFGLLCAIIIHAMIDSFAFVYLKILFQAFPEQ